MNDSQEKLFVDYVKKFVGLEPNELSDLKSIFRVKEIVSEHHMEEPSEEKSTLFFVVSGLVRLYYLSEGGKEWNKAFISSGMMSTSFSRDLLKEKSPYGIQALEDTTILIAEYSAFEVLFEKYHMIERLGRKIVENILIFKMNRERSFLNDSAKKRYEEFVREYDTLLTRIPQYHIASYLGITEASLSRIVRNNC